MMTAKCLQWQEWLADCARSGLGVQRWCAAHDIPEHRFYYWRCKLSTAVEVLEQDVEWLALPTDASHKLTVRVGAASIDIAAGFDPSLLRAVVDALAARC
jgi:hypothetical protein